MHDTGIEDRLRVALRGEADELSLTITAAELERRLAARRGSRSGRRLSLIAAAIAVVAIGAIGAMSNGWLPVPAIGTTGAPSPTATASPSPSASAVQVGVLEPIPATPGRIEVTRIDPVAPTDPVDRTFQGEIRDPFVAMHVMISCLGDGTVDFYLDGQHEHEDCSSVGESSASGVLAAADSVLDYRLVTTGRISYGLLVDLQVVSESLPSDDPAAFRPPAMQVNVSTLGQPGQTRSLTTGCWFTYTLSDGETQDGGCAEPPALDDPVCCEALDVPYGSDLTFTMPEGWSIDRSDIETVGTAWVDDRSAPSRSITGWRDTGDRILRFEGTFSKDGNTFKTSYGVQIQGPVAVPAVDPPARTCGTPDLSVSTPPAVRLVVDGGTSVAGTMATTNWGTTSHPVDSDPLPKAAIEIPAGATLTLRIAGDVCATDWRIEYGPPVNGSSLSVDRVGSLALYHRTPPESAANGHANRFDLAALPPGEWYIEAELRYADGDAAVGWHVIVK